MPNPDDTLQQFIDKLDSLTSYTEYRGALNVEQMAECIDASRMNARSLFEDAVLLYEHGHYERALALAILSIEESNKPAILFSFFILFLNDKIPPSQLWKDYRNHTAKSKGWMMPLMDSLLELPSLISKKKFSVLQKEQMELLNSPKYARIVNLLKQRCLYSDCVDDGTALLPSDLPAEALSTIFIDLARFSSKRHETADLDLLRLIQKFLEQRDFDDLIPKLNELNPSYSFIAEFLLLILSGEMNEEKCLVLFQKYYSNDGLDDDLLRLLVETINKKPLILNAISHDADEKIKNNA